MVNFLIKGKTFVKWAGGKKGVIDELVKYSPKEFDTYFETFIVEKHYYLT